MQNKFHNIDYICLENVKYLENAKHLENTKHFTLRFFSFWKMQNILGNTKQIP